MTERQGVEIDYCPKCRGVWLDRGELDKIIDRSANIPQQLTDAAYESHDRYSERDHEFPHTDKKKKKRESFLNDLFDFG
jgi:Zn-finger nucleic acid-binding protein